MKVTLALILCAISQLQAANVIVNGQFEDPVQADGTLGSYPNIPGWSPRGTATGIYVVGSNPPISSWPVTGQGGAGQFADIGNAAGTGIMQTIAIPVGFGLAELSWHDATSDNSSDLSTYQVRLLDSLNEVVASGSYSTAVAVWAPKSLTGIGSLAPGMYTIEFEPTSGVGNKDTLIDNVQLIPEPGQGILIAIASLFLTIRRRRI